MSYFVVWISFLLINYYSWLYHAISIYDTANTSKNTWNRDLGGAPYTIYIYILLAYHAFLSIFLSLLRVHVHVLVNLIFFIFATNPRFKVGACAAQFFTMMNAQTAPKNLNPILLQRIWWIVHLVDSKRSIKTRLLYNRQGHEIWQPIWHQMTQRFVMILCVTCVLCLNWKTYFLLKPGLG